MVKWFATVLCLCGILLGCGNQSPPISSPWQNGRLEIMATVITRPLDASFRLFIDGDLVIKDTTEIGAGSTQNFHGFWNGNRILARIERKQFVFTSSTRIDVFINGNLVEIVRL